MLDDFDNHSTTNNDRTNVTLTTKKIQELIDVAVEPRNTWIPTIIMEISINNNLCRCIDGISFINRTKFITKATCDII